MICPVCKRKTDRMVYRRGHKLCADCANPDFLRMMDLGFGMMGPDIAALVGPVCATYMRERYGIPNQTPSRPPKARTALEVESILASMGQSARRWCRDCPECRGSGRDEDSATCNHCGGDGRA